MIATKRCSKCKQVMPLENFYRCDGLKTRFNATSWCISCLNKKNRTGRPVPDLEGEEWVDIKGYEGLYKISNKLRVKSLDRTFITRRGREGFACEHIINPYTPNVEEKISYPKLGLTKNAKSKSVNMHSIVAEAFIPNTENKPCINHKDANPLNYAIANLEWCTFSENTLHAYRMGRINKTGEKNHMAKLDSGKVLQILECSGSSTEVASKFFVHGQTVLDIRRGRRWSHVTGIIYKKKN